MHPADEESDEPGERPSTIVYRPWSIVHLIPGVIGLRGEKLGYAAKFAGRKKGEKVLSWVQVAVNLLKESWKFLNLLLDNKAGCLSLHKV